jgi:hypothetical protein
MKLFVVSLVAACALLVAVATSAFADTDSHFPEGVSSGQACTTVLDGPAVGAGSVTGVANKVALGVDACLGGP